MFTMSSSTPADKTPEQIVDIMVEKVEEWKPQAC